jgi:hypothetical protein
MRRIQSWATVESRSEFEAGKGRLEIAIPESFKRFQEDEWKQTELETPANCGTNPQGFSLEDED